ncbi:MAG: hypothetical protein PHV37_09635 [Candidatus Gastranaerophilales bacterium]|nr:hypothetical protein [Candidatus Gastranaerophilales bacterium]
MLVNNQIPKQNYANTVNAKKQNFKGLADGLTTVLSGMEAQPMLKVSFVDTVATNVPRTVVDLKTGIPAAIETARREFSGLIVNCLIPSFFVLGVAKLINKPIMHNFKNVDMSKSWADENTIQKLSSIYKSDEVGKDTHKFVRKTIESLEGFDTDKFHSFVEDGRVDKKNIDKAVDILTNTITNTNATKKETKTAIGEAYKLLIGETKSAETIRFVGDKKAFSSNLSDLLRDQVELGRKFLNKNVSDNIDDFAKSAKKMINTKSLIGLGIIMPLAMSMQYINRAITRHKYKQKGAPIYKDFGKGKNTQKEMTTAEKSTFFMEKCAAAGAMIGLATLSMMKKPSLKMLQFKGMFPTLDQCRWIATGTFASRMFAAEDKNELRESTVRDLASFSGLYFLGDYAEKAAATLIEKKKPDVHIINKLVADDKTKALPKRFWNWVKNYKLKSFDEITDVTSKNMRSVSQLAGLAFSIVSLGIILPRYNRSVTEKKVKREKEMEAAKQQALKLQNEKMPNAFKGFDLNASITKNTTPETTK